MSASDFIQQHLDSGKKVTLFIWTTCPFCRKAIGLFQDIYGDDFDTNVNVVDIDDRSDVKAELGKITGASSVPRIFIDKKSIGGNDKVQSLNTSGELKPLLGLA